MSHKFNIRKDVVLVQGLFGSAFYPFQMIDISDRTHAVDSANEFFRMGAKVVNIQHGDLPTYVRDVSPLDTRDTINEMHAHDKRCPHGCKELVFLGKFHGYKKSNVNKIIRVK